MSRFYNFYYRRKVMKPYAAIDIGTNSIRLLIAYVDKDRIVKCYKDLETTRIGENVDKSGVLSEAAMERSIKAITNFVQRVRQNRIDNLQVIATSAVRDAQNRDAFIQKVKAAANVDIDVISGEREAYLGFLGVLKGSKDPDEKILVIDIGGGSTELIIGNPAGIQQLMSLNLGAVRMTEKYITVDPITRAEMEQLIEGIDTVAEDAIKILKKHSVDRVIGIGGTATTLGAMHKKLEVYDREQIHNLDISTQQLKDLWEMVAGSTLTERKQMKGLHPKRADVITAGITILDRLLTKLGFASIRISEYDNLEGLVFEQVEKPGF